MFDRSHTASLSQDRGRGIGGSVSSGDNLERFTSSEFERFLKESAGLLQDVADLRVVFLLFDFGFGWSGRWVSCGRRSPRWDCRRRGGFGVGWFWFWFFCGWLRLRRRVNFRCWIRRACSGRRLWCVAILCCPALHRD